MNKPTFTTYNGCKLKTLKNRKTGTYATFIFPPEGIQAVKEITSKLKKDSIALAKIAIDYNEYNFLNK